MVNIFSEELSKDDVTSNTVYVTCTLLPCLARDLRQEFYPHLIEIVHALTKALDPTDSENVESIFSCLAFMFKCVHISLPAPHITPSSPLHHAHISFSPRPRTTHAVLVQPRSTLTDHHHPPLPSLLPLPPVPSLRPLRPL